MSATKPNYMKPLYIMMLSLLTVWVAADSATATQKIVLVTGETMEVDQARVEDTKVWISWSGLTLSIDKKDVLRIEGEGKQQYLDHDAPVHPQQQAEQAKPEKSPPQRLASQRTSTATAPPDKRTVSPKKERKRISKSKPGRSGESPEPGGLSKSAEQLSALLKPGGFGAMKWGDHLTTLTGLRKLDEDSELPEVCEYTRPDEPIQVGSDAKDTVVKYAFWKNRLYMVTLWAAGPEAYELIREAMVNRYGPGIQSPDKKQTYYWIDDSADRMIDYLEDEELGMLWMRSRDINHQYKLTQLRIPINAGRTTPAAIRK